MDMREQMQTIAAINSKLESQKQRPSYHMAASQIGNPCDRALWYSFRWVTAPHFDGRMLRLFSRGADEEKRFVRYLKSVGVDIRETGTHQREIHVGPWIKGYADGIIYGGLKESPTNKHVAEFKTSNDKSFRELQAKGCKAAKPLHYTQQQLYMLATGIERSFYLVVNKNDDSLYSERSYLDMDFAQAQADRANNLAMQHNIPQTSGTAFDWRCKYCDFYGLCFGQQEVQHNCRTCEYCKFTSETKVICTKHNCELGPKAQMKGCKDYKVHPDMEAKPWWEK